MFKWSNKVSGLGTGLSPKIADWWNKCFNDLINEDHIEQHGN